MIPRQEGHGRQHPYGDATPITGTPDGKTLRFFGRHRKPGLPPLELDE